MNRLGVTFIVIGFGSAALAVTHSHVQFILLSWADPMQPWVGLLVGIAGVVMFALRIRGQKQRQAAIAQARSGRMPMQQTDPYGAAGPRPYTNGIAQPGRPEQYGTAAYVQPTPYGQPAPSAPPTPYGQNIAQQSPYGPTPAAPPRTDYSGPQQPIR